MDFEVDKVYANMRAMGTTASEKLGWTDPELQRQNFRLLTGMLKDVSAPLPGLSLHDAGCGTGDLVAFLQEEKLEPRSYVGTDFTAESLTIARERFPSHDFRQLDLVPRSYTSSQCPKADVTLAFGVLAYHKPRVVESILNHLWENTACVLGFSCWWNLDERYLYGEHIMQLRKCVNRFLRGKQAHQKLGTEYGQPTESLFVVCR